MRSVSVLLVVRRASSAWRAETSTAWRLRPGEAETSAEKTILFVRHAEGWHNADEKTLPNWRSDRLGETEAYRDAKLTPAGVAQCDVLRRRLQNETKPDAVVVSTLSRAIQTATLAFVEGPFPYVATELARERVSTHKCDQRSFKSTLVTNFPHVDFDQVTSEDDDMWVIKENQPEEYASTACSQRALDLLAWLYARDEPRIAVVSHWVFLRHLFRQFPAIPDEPFANAEMRAVALSPLDGDDL